MIHPSNIETRIENDFKNRPVVHSIFRVTASAVIDPKIGFKNKDDAIAHNIASILPGKGDRLRAP